jgi:hypothetical protein
MENPANPSPRMAKKLWCDPTIVVIDQNTVNSNKTTIRNVKESTLVHSGSHGHKAGSPGATYSLKYVIAS